MHTLPHPADGPSFAAVASAETAARNVLLADMDAFSDFLSCSGATHVVSERVTRIPALVPQRLAEADLPQVLHIVLTGDAGDALAARDELVCRYLAAHGEYLGRLAADELEG